MAQILNAADSAGSSLFDTVTTTFGTLEKSVTAVDHSLDVLLTTTSEWRDSAIEDAAINRMERRENYVNQRAINIAKDQLRMSDELKNSPELAKLFKQIKERHSATVKELSKA